MLAVEVYAHVAFFFFGTPWYDIYGFQFVHIYGKVDISTEEVLAFTEESLYG